MNKPKLELRKPQLCLVTDPTIPDLVHLVELALDAGITMLQIRGPQLSAHQLYDLALTLRLRCLHYGVACIINDRIDIAMAVQADGLQLGHHALPIAVARNLVGPGYLLGASVHSLDEAQIGLAQGADFLLAGTIFVSRSHPGEPIKGPQLLHSIKLTSPNCTLLAIGGITCENAGEVMATGADGLAVISAILKTQNVSLAVKALRQEIGL